MKQIVEKTLQHQIVPVVMSSFVCGDRRSDRFARKCSNQLQQYMTTQPRVAFVDAYSTLDQHPRKRMLLGDGTHLSISGHKVVADVLFPHLEREYKKLSTPC